MSNQLGKGIENKIENILQENSFSYIKNFQMLGKTTPDFVVNDEWIIEAKEFARLESIQAEIRDVIAKKALADKFGLDYKWLLIIHSNIYFFPSSSIITPSLYFDAALISPLLSWLPDIITGKVRKRELFFKEIDFYFDNYAKKDRAFPCIPYGFLLTLEKEPQKIKEYVKILQHSSLFYLYNFIKIAQKCGVIKKEKNPEKKRENIYTLIDPEWRFFIPAFKIGHGDYKQIKNVEMLKYVYEKIKNMFK